LFRLIVAGKNLCESKVRVNTLKTKILMTFLAGFLVVSVLSTVLLAEKPDDPAGGGKPDKLRPVPATDIELVKKISLRGPKGPPSWAGGGGAGKGKKEQAATGILGDPVQGRRYAIVVGISNYPGEENDLEYCDDDAVEMRDALTNVYGFKNVTLLTDLEATRDAILSAIDDIPTDAGEIVFFFSGHGMRGIAEDNDNERVDEAIVAHNGTNLVPIWDGELRDAFSGFETSRIIFVFDTCLAGGMKSDLEGPGRIIAMASTENGYSYETDALENGEFTYYFVQEGIGGGKANIHDYNDDTVIEQPAQVTVEEAFDYARANCSLDKPMIGDGFDDDLLP